MTLSPTDVAAATSVVVLVSPADGVPILREVMASLQGDFPGAIVILAHRSARRERGIADNLNVASNVMVHPGVPGVPLRDGHAYVVNADARIAIGGDGRFTDAYGADADDDALLLGDSRDLTSGAGRSEAMLASLAARYGKGALAVALTALDESEKAGFVRIRQAGGHTFALDEADRRWLGVGGPPVVPDPADELLEVRLMGPRLIAAARSGQAR